MLAVKVLKKNAERIHKALVKQGILAREYKPFREKDFVFFPVSRKVKLPVGATYCRKNFEEQRGARSLKQLLSALLTKKQLREFSAGFDFVGDIAIIELPKPLEKKAKAIAQAVLETNPHVKTVFAKTGGRRGVYRLPRLKWLAGKRKSVTRHKESSCVFEVDVRRTYFSPRTGTERARVASQVKEEERVLALFAGVGPYPILVAKTVRDVNIVAIELNPVAVGLMRKNVSLNKIGGKIRVVEGDVKKVLRKRFKKWADRIMMPLPLKAGDFLSSALGAARKGCVIHFYALASSAGRKNVFKEALDKIRKECKQAKLKPVMLKKKIVSHYAPHVEKIVVDFMVV